MSNIVFSHQNAIDDAATILSASSEVGNLFIQNVADTRIAKRWRCTSPSCYGQADFGQNVDVNVVALVFPRDTAIATGTVTHRFDANGGTPGTGALLDSGALDIGAVDGYGYHVYRLASTISARYWRWTYALTSAFADTGRAWAGTVWSPSVNFDLGAGDEWEDLSVVTVSKISGAEFVDERSRRRSFSFSLGFLDDNESDVVREMKRIVGISKQVLCIRDPDSAPLETILGRLRDVNPITDANFNLNSTAFNVRESL